MALQALSEDSCRIKYKLTYLMLVVIIGLKQIVKPESVPMDI